MTKTIQKMYQEKAKKIKLLLTDCDGVLTDTGVYYSAKGEELKRFSIRDGMGVERLWNLAKVKTGIITGENVPSVAQRAAKLNISELHLGVKDKLKRLQIIMDRLGLKREHIAYIGDDYNDLEVMEQVGLTACPADGMESIKNIADFKCTKKGGHGAFREFAELIIQSKTSGLRYKATRLKAESSKI